MSRTVPSPPAAWHVYQAADTERAGGTWPDDPFAFETLNDAGICEYLHRYRLWLLRKTDNPVDSFTQDQLADLDPGVFVLSNNSSTFPDNNGATNSVSSHHSDLQDPFDVAFRGNWPTVQEPKLSIDTTTVSPIDLTQPMRSPVPRSLPRRRSKYTMRQRSRSGTRPIAIPAPYTANSAPQSLAMQRWRDSPPEDEAASFTAITNALQWQDGNLAQEHTRSTACPALETRAPSSSTSIDSESSATSTHSGQSSRSARSKTSQRGSRRKPAERRKRDAKAGEPSERPFKCTFCCDDFKHKYDWSRHEKSLHLSLATWQCAPDSGAVIEALTNRLLCIYCREVEPSTEHLEAHYHTACRTIHDGAPTFRRKDHLVQHLRLVHHVDAAPQIDDWKLEQPPITSRCGFCDVRLSSWDERTGHMAAHFRNGKTMADWTGEHEFEAHVAACVKDALPPYLVAYEAQSLVPYSATSGWTKDHYTQVSSQIASRANPTGLPGPFPPIARQKMDGPDRTAESLSRLQGQDTEHAQSSRQQTDLGSFAQILALHLGRFAREQVAAGVFPSDELFQREARRVLYGDEDEWNQSIADNSIWLDQIRRQNS